MTPTDLDRIRLVAAHVAATALPIADLEGDLARDIVEARGTARTVFDALVAMGVCVRSVGYQHRMPQLGMREQMFLGRNGPFVTHGQHKSGHTAMAFAAQTPAFLTQLAEGLGPFVDRMVATLPLLQGRLGSCSFQLNLDPSGWLNPAGTLTVNVVRVTERIGVFVARAAHLRPATVFSQRPGRRIAAASESEATILTEIASR